MTDILPIGKTIRNRKTGQEGPIAPIFAEDWPFVQVPDDETLWRYMDMCKFEDLLRTKALYFTRGDCFTDPFEGRFSLGNNERASRSEEAFRRLYRIKMDDSERKSIEIQRKVAFINCWHRNTHESLQMWEAYTASPDSVVITTTVKALRLFLPAKIMQFGVKYTSLDHPRTEFSLNSLFYYKPEDYAFEREFRLLRSPEEHEVFYSEKPEDKYRRIPIELKKIVHRVYTHPRATLKTKTEVNKLLFAYLPSLMRQDSAIKMSKLPVYRH